MTRCVVLLLAIGIAVGCTSSRTAQTPLLTWKSFDEAVSASESTGKLILVEVYVPWCGWCKRLERDVYTDAAVHAYMTNRFELTRLDGEDTEQKHTYAGVRLSSSALTQRLGAHAYPTTLILAPGGTRVLASAPGYLEPERYLQVLQYIAEGDHLK